MQCKEKTKGKEIEEKNRKSQTFQCPWQLFSGHLLYLYSECMTRQIHSSVLKMVCIVCLFLTFLGPETKTTDLVFPLIWVQSVPACVKRR